MKSFFLTRDGKKRIKVHLLVWTAYWCLELFLFSLSFSNVLNDRGFLYEILLNLFSGTVFFYILILFVLPAKAEAIKSLQLLGRLAVAISICVVIRYLGVQLLVVWVDFKSAVVTNIKFFGVSSFDILSRYGIYAALFWFFRRQGELNKQILEKELDEEKLKHELLETKYAVLKAQINPHFLFNSLNFIHSKAILHNDEVLDRAILLLSDILRRALKDNTNRQTIDIDQEIDHLMKLCELHKLRFNGEFYVEIIEEGSGHHSQIPALILLTFFENAIKHGVYDDPDNPIKIHIVQSSQQLEIVLANKTRKMGSVSSRDQFSIGKRYVHNTLEHFCKNNYILDYHNDDSFHTVHLKIYEDQLYNN